MAMSDLERHALAWRMNGLPVFADPDDWGDAEVVDVVAEPSWALDDLTEDQRGEIGRAFLALLDERDRRGRDMPDARVYGVVLDEWGITCPHPPHWRGPIGDGRRPGFVCAACDVWVVPLDEAEQVAVQSQ